MMKCTTITCFLSALYSATCVLADALPSPASSPEAQSAEVTPMSLPILEADENTHLEVRQNQNANLGVAQPAVFAIQEEYIYQPVQQVIQVIVMETVTVLPNRTFGAMNSTSYNGSASAMPFGNMTTTRRNDSDLASTLNTSALPSAVVGPPLRQPLVVAT
ncbi:hypothetical protein D0864_05724 [Hortaea werneckii]|uniref:Uncharacterized protein n=1 Tax=Hortaea werneckii TaxID=91943 RepID=A0A3M7FWX8_HORWE|nr:hypothetical protein D0864_05724 [Hortaea werneckii]RMZ07108.1 hypothetical protein D0862_04374 [Hortaea werneckii]